MNVEGKPKVEVLVKGEKKQMSPEEVSFLVAKSCRDVAGTTGAWSDLNELAWGLALALKPLLW